MSFSKDLIISLVILAVVLEADLGYKKVGWFRVGRPFITALAIAPAYLKSLPSGGHNMLLQGGGALLGLVLGLLAVSPAFVEVGYDPSFRSWVTKLRKAPSKPATVTSAGSRYALLWAAATGARLVFAWGSKHAFPHALHMWLGKNQLSADALTNALIFFPVGMDVFRSIGLMARAAGARSRGALEVSRA